MTTRATTGRVRPGSATLGAVSALQPAGLRGVHPLDLIRPRFRGVLHQYATGVAVAIGCVLIALAHSDRARAAATVYAVSLAAVFGTSALYHRITWRPSLRAIMQRLDHSMIYVFIAGTYTPFAVLTLHGGTAATMLAIAWTGALLGVGSRVLFDRTPRYVTVPLYAGLGWTAAFVVPQLIGGAGVAPFVLLCVGGLGYTVGGLMYAFRWPNPSPRIFGYHEMFHLLTIVAALCHYVAVSFAVYQAG